MALALAYPAPGLAQVLACQVLALDWLALGPEQALALVPVQAQVQAQVLVQAVPALALAGHWPRCRIRHRRRTRLAA